MATRKNPAGSRSKARRSRSGTSTPNELRSRPLITMTMSRKGVAVLDKQRGNMSRGVFIEQLLKVTA
jgi:hypothetical protein